MAILLHIQYAKKLGLPHYSSHQCSLSLQLEITDAAQVQSESHRLYTLLQAAVDADLQQVGFLPGASSATVTDRRDEVVSRDGDDLSAATTAVAADDDGIYPADEAPAPSARSSAADVWACSDKQKQLILQLVHQLHLDKREVEALARERCGLPVKTLNRAQASGLIEALLAQAEEQHPHGGNGHNAQPPRRRSNVTTAAGHRQT